MTVSYRPAVAATLLALLSSTSLVHAANLNSNTMSNGNITATETITVTADRNVGAKAKKGTAAYEALSQAPLSAIEPTSIISARTIQNTIPANSDYASALATVPSMVVNSPNGMGNGEATNTQLRGFSDGQFNITIDGIPFGDTNDFTHHTTAYFPSDILDDITVDRGPGFASTVGEATFGGTVALHSLATTDQAGGTVTAGYGSFDTRHLAVQLQSGKFDNIGTEAVLSVERNLSNGAMTLAKTGNSNATLKINQPIDDRFVLTAFSSLQKSTYNNNNQISGYQESLYGKDYAALNNDPDSQQWVAANKTRKNTDFEYLNFAGDAGLFDINNKLYTYGYSNHENDSNNPNSSIFADDPNGQETDALGYKKLNRYRSVGDILTLSRDIDAGALSGTLKAGAWVEHQNNDRDVYWFDYNTGESYLKKLKNQSTPVYSNYKYLINSKIDTFQPFMQYSWKPIDGLTITPGYKYVSFSRLQDGPIDQTSQLPIDYTAHYHANLPYLSVNYKFTPNVSAYAQYAKGFLSPNVNVLYVVSEAANSVAPEQTTNYQFGTVFRADNLTADVDAYYINFTNYVTPITTLVDGVEQSGFTNDGSVIYKGLEGEATYIVGQGVNLFVSGSLNSAKPGSTVSGTDEVPLAPQWTLNFGPQFDNGTYFGSFLTKYVGPTPDATGTYWVKTYDTSNLVAGVHLGAIVPRLKDIKLSLGLYNVLDHRNILDETAALNSNGSLNFDASTFDYLAPRSIYATVAASF